MAYKRITMQDIADACNLSRNTVSKVFNGRGSVPEATRQLILAKAKELGYGLPVDQSAAATIPPATPEPEEKLSTIMVLYHSNPLNHHFGYNLIKAFTDQICRSGYMVQMYEISDQELSSRTLPPHISLASTSAILGIELFDKDYTDMLCQLDKPTLMIDGYCDANRNPLYCDYLSMENFVSTMEMTRQLLACEAVTLGFVGDPLHCNSFHERWGGFSETLQHAGLQVEKQFCIIEPSGMHYADPAWLNQQLDKMPHIPDAFVCANDSYAIPLIATLKARGLRIPEDVMIVGFDDSPEASIVEPKLTSAAIYDTEMGIMAADLLLGRISNPSRPFGFFYLKTEPHYRASSCK